MSNGGSQDQTTCTTAVGQPHQQRRTTLPDMFNTYHVESFTEAHDCFLAHASETRGGYCVTTNPSDMGLEPIKTHSQTLRFSLVCGRRQYSTCPNIRTDRIPCCPRLPNAIGWADFNKKTVPSIWKKYAIIDSTADCQQWYTDAIKKNKHALCITTTGHLSNIPETQ